MHKLGEVIISITNRCNSSCKMCDIPKLSLDELSTSRWKAVIKDAALLGASTVVFSGGEPLLRQDLFELIAFSKSQKLSACITSNGLLLDEECAAKLSGAGVDVVNISIEGGEEIHDYLRGKGSFRKAILALGALKKNNIESTIATMVSRYNYKYLKYIAELAVTYGVTTLKLQPFNVMFLIDKSKERDFLLSRREAVELTHIIKEMTQICKHNGITTNPFGYLERLPSYLSKNFSHTASACKSLWTSCPINARGDIYPCWVLAHDATIVGNVKEKKLTELWNSQQHIMIREKIKEKGCCGCMMSCYDESFGDDSFTGKITVNIERLKKDGVREFMRKKVRMVSKRFQFYRAYRGPLRNIVVRGKRYFKREKLPSLSLGTEEVERVQKDIEKVKKMFKEKIEFLS